MNCTKCVELVFTNAKTGKRVTVEEMPVLVFITNAYETQSPEQKEAWHRVACENSRDERDLDLIAPFLKRLENLKPS